MRLKKILLVIGVVASYSLFFFLTFLLINDWYTSETFEIESTHWYLLVAMFAWLLASLLLARSLAMRNHSTFGEEGKDSTPENLNSEVLINSIVDGVMLVGSDGAVKIFNPAAATITGWATQEAVGLDYKSIMSFFDPKGMELAANQNPITECFSSAKPVNHDSAIIKNHTGKTVELDLMCSPILSKKNSALAVMVIFRDVSKQRVEERQRAEFISTASHEMRTPVAAIEGYLALAMNEKVAQIDPSARSYLEKAHSSTKQLGKLFQDLLTAAKSEDGRLSSHPVPIEVGAFLRDVTERMRFVAEEKGLVVRYKPSNQPSNVIDTTDKGSPGRVIEPIYYVLADPDRMREVLTNLFDNAVKYTDEGSITIGMSAGQGSVIISIADTGPGISKSDLPHLFQKFYRVDNSDTRQIGGTGLGLFICKQIVELYGGKIWADSVVDKGSVFNISFPQLDATRAKELIRQDAANKSPLDDSSTAASANPVSSNLNDSQNNV